jgi:hypothetical protein
MKYFGLIVIFCLCGVPLRAQTASYRLAWDHLGVLPTFVTQNYAFTLKVDTNAPMPMTPICVAKGTTDTTCSIPVTAGVHTYVVGATSAGGPSNSDPFTVTGTSQPVHVSITVTVTVP